LLPAKGDGLFVYVYPAQVKDGVYPFGADVRYLVSPDGSNIVEKRQLHKTVIESNPADTPGGQLSAGFHTHILSDIPEDTDVLLVLTRKPRVPEYVAGQGKYMYEIGVDGKIKVVKK
jgi:hypothetical protein